MSSWLGRFLEEAQVLHICGLHDEARTRSAREQLPAELRARYHVYGYLHEEMALALAAADLAVMRSGASTLGELPAARLPAVLVPGEYEGWDQGPNARYLADRGAAVMLPQDRIGAGLEPAVRSLLADPRRLASMREALSSLARPRAAADLAAMLVDMAGGGSKVAA
jgi:UDP-N-acetylglucosamine--N-acetylmuramyl-(pentapeptide) pyrophosphoryl-undecaprenol N-acetylglucosamine transferase